MSFPTNITKEHLLKAIEKIDLEGIPADAQSRYYDVLYNEKRYPPKLVVSLANFYASGKILERNSFHGGIGSQGFKLLEQNGFTIIEKMIKNYWIEKTIVNGRKDRIEGDRALGKVLWSPIKSSDGKDIYYSMRSVKVGDVILHLVDNEKFIGVSIVKKQFIETTGIKGTDWEGPAYLIELEDYVKLEPPIDRDEILNKRNELFLKTIMQDSTVFYTYDLKLRQGAYLTPCPEDLLRLINKAYFNNTNTNIPYVSLFEKSINLPMFDISKIYSDLVNARLFFAKNLVTRIVCSLITKPFVILTGLSGSGKTKLAQAFAMWVCDSKKQYSLVPVGADWTNREPLLGFPNSLKSDEYVKPDNGALDLIIEASADKNKPYFLILDEMNLSHVERYFADFLSVMESKETIKLYDGKVRKDSDGIEIPQAISWPENLYIVGTVNIDETTYMFSPKVLDRANVIEFSVTNDEMSDYLENTGKLNLDDLKKGGINMASDFVDLSKNITLKTIEQKYYQEILLKFFDELKKTGAEFGYRSASEIMRFATVVNKIMPDWDVDKIMDAAIMQKLLPKVHGSRRRLAPVLETLGMLCFKEDLNEKEKIKEYLSSADKTITIPEIKYPLSFDKISRMYRNLINNGFTSYAEA